MLGFTPRARFVMRLYIAPLLFCTIFALPGSAQFTAGHALNATLIQAPPTQCAISAEAAPQLQGSTMGTIAPETAPQLQGATMGTIGPQTAPQLQGATMGTIGPEAAPQLQGATMGTIGPQGNDATEVTGINTPGEVRVNMLANLEALLNLVTNGVMIVSLLWGGGLFISAICCSLKEKGGVQRSFVSVAFVCTMFTQGTEWLSALFSALLMRMDSTRAARKEPVIRFWMACFIIKMSLLLPAMVNWLVASARDANLFS